MKKAEKSNLEPSWLDPRNDRKKPHTDAELDIFVEDFIARFGDTKAWWDLVGNVGEGQARQILRERMLAQDPNSLINWEPDGLLH